MLKEYNFSPGVRGKYAKRYAQGANVPVKRAHANGGAEMPPRKRRRPQKS